MKPLGAFLSRHKPDWPLWLPVIGVFTLGLMAILYHTYWREADNRAMQLAQGRQAAALTMQVIDQHLRTQRHLLQLFTRTQAKTLDAVISNPGDRAAEDALRSAVRTQFPDAFAFTVSDDQGLVLLDDFEGLVGEHCRLNIRDFALHADQHLHLHPHALKAHYDVMVRYGGHVFFVSFAPEHLRKLLLQYAPPGIHLLLLKRDSDLIEVCESGPRPHLRRPAALTANEKHQLLAAFAVPDTDWRVAAVPDFAAQNATRRHLYMQSGLLLGVLTLLAGIFQVRVWQEHQQRLVAEAEAHEMAELGLIDALTGLPNRRALDADLAREWRNLERSDEPLALLMIDLDHFKRYNDTYGHLAGDNGLRRVAQAMRAVLKRPRDRIARFGGEEFAVLLPNTTCEAAKPLADTLHGAVATAFADAPNGQITLSIGLTCAQAGQLKNAEALLALADEALYTAKRSGRNTTITLTPHN